MEIQMNWRKPWLNSCNDLEGNRKGIKRYEVFEVQETLDVHLAPAGSTTEQMKKKLHIAHKWADFMRTGPIAH